jgi:predicted regulator of Ras-like GTPase activity (Roadblock/LC7/MglB family)
MADTGFGDYFVRDLDEEALEEGGPAVAPVIIPGTPGAQPAQQRPPQPQPQPPVPTGGAPQTSAPPQPVAAQFIPQTPPPTPVIEAAPVQPVAAVAPGSREDQLIRTLNAFMSASSDVQAAALVSLDGFIIASALPKGMQEDRVGAMSAAILGLGERAAAELGRGHLTQVFIEGADGYVLLIAAGDRAVMTALAAKDAKLGLVLYDMKSTAERIGDILR